MIEGEKFELDDVAAAQEFLRELPARSRTQGKLLAGKGAVRGMEREDPGRGFTVRVQGQALFTVSLFYEDGAWDAECDCDKVFDCEHAYAAMTALLARQSGEPAISQSSALEQRLLDHLKR